MSDTPQPQQPDPAQQLELQRRQAQLERDNLLQQVGRLQIQKETISVRLHQLDGVLEGIELATRALATPVDGSIT